MSGKQISIREKGFGVGAATALSLIPNALVVERLGIPFGLYVVMIAALFGMILALSMILSSPTVEDKADISPRLLYTVRVLFWSGIAFIGLEIVNVNHPISNHVLIGMSIVVLSWVLVLRVLLFPWRKLRK